MRKCKRIVSAMLAVSMVMGMTAFPALAEPLGIQGESRVETGITVVSHTYDNAAITSYYANDRRRVRRQHLCPSGQPSGL